MKTTHTVYTSWLRMTEIFSQMDERAFSIIRIRHFALSTRVSAANAKRRITCGRRRFFHEPSNNYKYYGIMLSPGEGLLSLERWRYRHMEQIWAATYYCETNEQSLNS